MCYVGTLWKPLSEYLQNSEVIPINTHKTLFVLFFIGTKIKIVREFDKSHWTPTAYFLLRKN